MYLRIIRRERKMQRKNSQLLDSPGANVKSTASISGGTSSVGTGASGSSAPWLEPAFPAAPESRPHIPIPAPMARKPADKDDERRCRGRPCAGPPDGNPSPKPTPPPTPAACRLRLPPPRAGRRSALRREPSAGVPVPARGERTARPARAA
jgi:hypothetical protein